MADKHSGNPNRQDGSGQKNNQNEDMLSGIRRISADSKFSEIKRQNPEQSSRKPSKGQNRSAKTAPSHNRQTPKRPDSISSGNTDTPSLKRPDASSVRKAEASSSKKSEAVTSKRPQTSSALSEKKREEIIRKKRMAAVFLVVMMLLVLVLAGFGIYHFYRFLNRKKFNKSESMVNSILELTYPTTTLAETTESTTKMTTEPTPTPTPAPTPFPIGGPDLSGYKVVIDAGHQLTPNLEQEAMSRSMGGSKDKSSQGFIGVSSGKDESEINLDVELLLASYLKSLGAEVTVTREQNDVNLSNKERAEMAVSLDPALYIRLFCNAANDSASRGCEVIVPSSGKYSSEVKTWGEALGKKLEEMTHSTFNGCKASGNYTGLNWADSIPTFMIRMGYLSNSDDEALLLSEEYQFNICKGVAEFIATMPKK